MSAKSLQSELVLSLMDRVTGPSRAVAAAMNKLNAAARNNAVAMDQLRGRMMDSVGMGYALARSLSAPINAAMTFESTMADIKKVVDFESPAAFQKMSKDIRDMSLRLPMTADAIGEIVAAAGQSGIATGELTKFTDIAAKVATAWDLSAGETGESLAKLKTALGMSLDDTASLADAINHLGNNGASSAKDILEVVKRVGPMGAQFNLTAEQIAALGSAMTGAGFEADVASTSILKIGGALTRGASATPRVQKAFKALGLSSRQVAKDMQKNSVGTLQSVLAQINKVPQHMRAAVITDLFGDEARALGPLISNGNLLADTMALVADKSKYAGSAQAEFDVRSKTTANNLQLFKNRVNDLGISVGNALIPAMNELLGTLGPVITSISNLVERFPKATASIIGAVGGVIALRVALTGLQFVGLFAKGGLIAAASGAVRMGGALLSLLNPLKIVRTAMLALRVAVISTGVGALLVGVAAAGLLIYNNWDGLTTMFSAFGSAFMGAIQPIIPLLQPVIDGAQSLYASVSNLLGPVEGLGQSWFAMGRTAGKAVGEALVSVTRLLTDLPGAFASTDWSALSGSMLSGLRSIKWDGIANTITSGLRNALASVSGALAPIRDMITSSLTSVNWSGVGSTISSGVAGVFDALTAAFGAIQWGSIGELIGAGIRGAVVGLAEIGLALASSIGGAITGYNWLDIISSMARTMGASLVAQVKFINGLIKGLFQVDLLQIGTDLVQSLWTGIKQKFEEVRAWFQSIPGMIREAIGKIDLSSIISWPEPPAWWSEWFGSGGKKMQAPSPGAPAGRIDGARAGGGRVEAGKTYRVNERGEELFTPGRSGTITPADYLRSVAREFKPNSANGPARPAWAKSIRRGPDLFANDNGRSPDTGKVYAQAAASGRSPVQAGGARAEIHVDFSPVFHISEQVNPRKLAGDISQGLADSIRAEVEGAFTD